MKYSEKMIDYEFSQSMITQLIRKAHDLLINEHSDMNQTLNLLR